MAEIDGNEQNSQKVEVSRIGLKIRSIYMLPTKDSLSIQSYKCVESERTEKHIFHTNNNQRRAGMARLTSGQMYFKSKVLRETKDLIF